MVSMVGATLDIALRPEHLQLHRCRQTDYCCELLCGIEEVATAHPAVHVFIEQVQKFLRKNGCLLAFPMNVPVLAEAAIALVSNQYPTTIKTRPRYIDTVFAASM